MGDPNSLLESGLRTLKTYKDMRVVGKGNRYRNIYEMDDSSIKKYAKFSAASYDENQRELLGYKLDSKLSTPQFRVFKKGSKVVFAIRGSKELVNDFVVNDLTGIAAGKEHLQLKQARTKLAQIQAKYPNSRLTLTGHTAGFRCSLAGLTSAALGAENGIKTYAFNPGTEFVFRSSPLGGEKYQTFLKNSFDNDFVTTTIAEGDAVSAGMVRHARADSLHVIANPDRSVKKTAARHFMNNFLENEHIKDINSTLKEHNVSNRASTIHKLHTSGKSDESLQKRATTLKTQLKGGGNLAINEGEYLGSGGFHAAGFAFRTYAAKNNLMTLGKEKVPAPGARVQRSTVAYVSKEKGLMYVFDKKHKPHFLTGTMEDKSATLRKFANKYNEGPTIFVDNDSKTGKPKQVALVPAHGGYGWNVVSATSANDWKTVLGGLNRHGQGGGWWSGKKSKHGWVGNAAVDPFQREPWRTTEDQEAAKLDDIGEFMFHNAVSFLQIGAEVAADALSGGLAELAVQSINTVLDQSGASSALQAELDKLIPDTRHDNVETIDNMFSSARTVDGSKPFSGSDKQLNFDERLPFRFATLNKNWKEIRSKGTELGLTPKEEAALWKLHPHYAEDKTTQIEQSQMLDKLEPKYEHMKVGMSAVKDLKDYSEKADKVGLGIIVDPSYNALRRDLIPDTGKFDKKTQWEDELKGVKESLNKTVQTKMDNVGDFYEKQRSAQLDYDHTVVAPMLDQMASKKDFDKVYKGKKTWGDYGKTVEYRKYRKQMWEAFKTEQGYEFDTGKLKKEDQYFVTKYLKKQPLSQYVKKDYFKGKTDEMSHLVDLQHDTQVKMEEKFEKDAADLKASKLKTVPEI